MKIGFYSGSFDPFTNGHLHVVKTSCKIFDKVIIGIGINPKKQRRYDNVLMKSAIEAVLKVKIYQMQKLLFMIIYLPVLQHLIMLIF